MKKTIDMLLGHALDDKQLDRKHNLARCAFGCDQVSLPHDSLLRVSRLVRENKSLRTRMNMYRRQVAMLKKQLEVARRSVTQTTRGVNRLHRQISELQDAPLKEMLRRAGMKSTRPIPGRVAFAATWNSRLDPRLKAKFNLGNPKDALEV